MQNQEKPTKFSSQQYQQTNLEFPEMKNLNLKKCESQKQQPAILISDTDNQNAVQQQQIQQLQQQKANQKIQKEKNNKANSDTEVNPRNNNSEESDTDSDKNNDKNSISTESFSKKKIKIGICAMKKKAESKPMKAILERMGSEDFEIIKFSEDIIFNQEIKNWPIVQVFISWYSEGFPLRKAQSYAKLRNPFLINDLASQEILWDRFQIYKKLKKANINQPKHFFIQNQNLSQVKNQYIQQEIDKLGAKLNQEDYLVAISNKKQMTKIKSHHMNMNLYQMESDVNLDAYQDEQQIQQDISNNNNENSVYDKDEINDNNINNNVNNECTENNYNNEYEEADIDDDDDDDSQEENNEYKYGQNEGKNKNPRRARSAENKKKKRKSSSFVQVSGLNKNESCENELIVEQSVQKKKTQYAKIEEQEDFIIIDGQKLKRPFVEKPQDAENHNIYIYYHSNDGGGCKKLFRKIDDKSSEYDKNWNKVRKDGNFIYEEFLPTNGFDIKVYAVGPDYVHAEARKAPSLDGIVHRTSTGKEVRFPVALTPEEKLISKKIVETFGQRVCGFDLLRSNGKSYVCDVNGWSFVKGNQKYYQDAGYVLTRMILERFGRTKKLKLYRHIQVQKSIMDYKLSKYRPNNLSEENENDEGNSNEVLRSVVAIFRHGDRTPKQKMKMKIKNELYNQFYIEQIQNLNKLKKEKKDKYQQQEQKKDKVKLKELKFKSPIIMEQFLKITLQIHKDLEENRLVHDKKQSEDILEFKKHSVISKDPLQQSTNLDIIDEKDISVDSTMLKSLDLQKQHISQQQEAIKEMNKQDIDQEFQRLQIQQQQQYQEKQQSQLLNQQQKLQESQEKIANKGQQDEQQEQEIKELLQEEMSLNKKKSMQQDFDESIRAKLLQLISVLQQHGNFEGINRKIQIKPIKVEEYEEDGVLVQKPVSLLIILKFGGDLTHSGAEQAQELGHLFRQMQYPIDTDGFIRLHNTYRHDLKTFTSDEGRCQKTAGEFLKGMLELEGDTAPIMTTLLTRNATAMRLLDQNRDLLSAELQNQLKEEISQILNSNENLIEHFNQRFQGQNISENVKIIMEKINRPLEKLQQINRYIQELTQCIFKEFVQFFDTLEDIYYIGPNDYHEGHEKIQVAQAQQELKACDQESLIVLYKRWKKLSIDFYDKSKGQFNISKIPDIYDSIKYDLIHNQNLFLTIYKDSIEFYEMAELMASFVIPMEFGITEEEKIQFAMELVSPLCTKIKNDLVWWKQQDFQEGEYWKYDQSNESNWRHIRTRLYFTSASHLYSLFNVLHLGLESMMIEKAEYMDELNQIKSLQYFSHIVFRLFEDLSAEENDNKRFRLELCISPGCQIRDIKESIQDHKVPISSLLPINMQLNINQVVKFFDAMEIGRESTSNNANNNDNKDNVSTFSDYQSMQRKQNSKQISPRLESQDLSAKEKVEGYCSDNEQSEKKDSKQKQRIQSFSQKIHEN